MLHDIASRLDAGVHRLARELVKFGVVGAVAFVVDVGLFNLARAGGGPLADKPLTAKAGSALLAITVAYVGNRYWTFRHRERPGVRREFTLFVLLNAVALGIALACLAVSHYVLGLDSLLADNIATNVVGLAVGTVFRFWSYRRWVFPEVAAAPATAEPLARLAPTAR